MTPLINMGGGGRWRWVVVRVVAVAGGSGGGGRARGGGLSAWGPDGGVSASVSVSEQSMVARAEVG